MSEINIVFPTAGPDLAATLATPDGALASSLAIFVHGSGPVDRNENLKGQHLDVFNTLAAGLTRRGIASLRYDKRGCGLSGGDYFSADFSTFRDDVVAAIRFARHEIASQRVFLIGHSEGTLLCALAHRVEPVDGLVLLMPFAQNLEPLLLRQAAEISRSIAEWPGLAGHVLRLLSAVRGGAIAGQKRFLSRAKSARPGRYPKGLHGLSVPSVKEGLALDIASCYAGIACPVLLVGGAKDLQCLPEDVWQLRNLLGRNAEAHVLEGMTHILRRDPGTPSLADYQRLMDRPLDSEIVRRVGDWLVVHA